MVVLYSYFHALVKLHLCILNRSTWVQSDCVSIPLSSATAHTFREMRQ